MLLRGLRDLQFTVNYFNQINYPHLLGTQLFFFFFGVGNGGLPFCNKSWDRPR